MRVWPARTLAARLFALSLLWIAAALIAAWLAIGAVLSDFVRDRFAQEMSGMSDAVLAALSARGVRAPAVVDPRFQEPLSGWYWQADLPDGETRTSDSLFLDTLAPGAKTGPDGAMLRVLTREVRLPGISGPVTLRVTAPQARIEAAIAAARRPLLISLAILGAGLIVAAGLQLYTGLAALRRIRRGLIAIRRGEAEMLDPSGLRDIDQVVEAINALLRARQDTLRRTRDYIGNLAHAMKTPLASLAADQDATQDQQALVTRMNRLVEYHLRRARSAGRAGGLGQRVVVREVMEDIAMVLSPRARGAELDIEIEADAAAIFIGDRGDLEEIVGNLADNAVTAAFKRVRLSARQGPETLVLRVEDDGPGLADNEITRALERGVRLDERGPGAGLGLGIVADLVKLGGGDLHFARAALGGLCVEITLPNGLNHRAESHRSD
jgi:signal transduction histidine kinase